MQFGFFSSSFWHFSFIPIFLLFFSFLFFSALYIPSFGQTSDTVEIKRSSDHPPLTTFPLDGQQANWPFVRIKRAGGGGGGRHSNSKLPGTTLRFGKRRRRRRTISSVLVETASCEHVELVDCEEYVGDKGMRCMLTATGMPCCICNGRLRLRKNHHQQQQRSRHSQQWHNRKGTRRRRWKRTVDHS